MPTITIDRDVLVQEIDDLVKCNNDADAKGKALTVAIEVRDQVRVSGEAKVLAAQDDATASNVEAEGKLTEATIASQVADQLLGKQIDHLKALVSGQAEDPDPTPAAPVVEIPEGQPVTVKGGLVVGQSAA